MTKGFCFQGATFAATRRRRGPPYLACITYVLQAIPCSISKCFVSKTGIYAASGKKGVHNRHFVTINLHSPLLSLANTLAPLKIKASAIASLPWRQQKCRAVWPSPAARSTSAPLSRRQRAAGKCPFRQAASRGVSPSGLTQLTSDGYIPRDTENRMTPLTGYSAGAGPPTRNASVVFCAGLETLL